MTSGLNPAIRSLAKQEESFPGLLESTALIWVIMTYSVKRGNVYCLDCANGIEQGGQSIVHGQDHRITCLPALPTFPNNLLSITNQEAVTGTGAFNQINIIFEGRSGSNTTFNPVCTSLSTNETVNCPAALRAGRGPVCAVDANGVSHCRLTNISLAGNAQITIDSTNGPVRFYIENFITLAGNTKLVHDTGGRKILACLAHLPNVPGPTFDSWSFQGNGNSTNAFIYGPCTKLGFDGAGSGGSDYDCC